MNPAEGFGSAEWLVVGATAFTVSLAVIFHYEVVAALNRWISRKRPRHGHHHRPLILMAMFVLLVAHVAEIWMFGLVLWLLVEHGAVGSIVGYEHISLLDSIYFSAATYSTVGWGDLSATGPVRFLAGSEALVGFLLITWTASFTYLVMARAWGVDGKH